MLETFAKFKTACLVLGAATSMGVAHANLVNNGNFIQIGPNGNPYTSTLPAPSSEWSAAAYWKMFVVEPNSHIRTKVETLGTGPVHVLHVTTNGGYWGPASMGNGVVQMFPATACATASFSIFVVSGAVTGNLIRTTGPFAAFPQFQPAGHWQNYSQYSPQAVNGIGFETLVGHSAEYYIRDVVVQPCEPAPVLFYEMPYYVAYDPFWLIKDPGAPYEKIRVTNNSAVTVEGPIHVLLEGLPQGRTVVNPDGDYRGTPYFTLASRSLAPGQSEVVTIQFNADPAGNIPSFRVRLGSFEAR